MTSRSPVEQDGALIYDLALADTEAYLVEPVGGGRGPGLIFLHWFDPEAPDGNRGQFLEEAAALAVSHGVVSVLPQGRFPWFSEPREAGSDVSRIGDEVSRHHLALDLLNSRPEVDPGRIGLVGHDFGAMHGVILAATDLRIGASVLIAPTPRWGDWFLPFWPIEGDRFDYLRAMSPLDPISRIGEVSPRPTCFQFAEGDFYLAPMTSRELYRAAGDPKEIHFYEADHAMRVAQARLERTAFLIAALDWTAD